MRQSLFISAMFLGGLLVSCSAPRNTASDHTLNKSRSKTYVSSTRSSPSGSTKGRTSGVGGSATARIASESESLIGTPYRYGGNSPQRGFDCSGLTEYVYRRVNIALPRTSSEQARLGTMRKYVTARPGDLIFFGTGARVNHVGIVVATAPGMIRVVHSTSSAGVISENVLASTYWSKRLIGVINFSDITRP